MLLGSDVFNWSKLCIYPKIRTGRKEQGPIGNYLIIWTVGILDIEILPWSHQQFVSERPHPYLRNSLTSNISECFVETWVLWLVATPDIKLSAAVMSPPCVTRTRSPSLPHCNIFHHHRLFEMFELMPGPKLKLATEENNAGLTHQVQHPDSWLTPESPFMPSLSRSLLSRIIHTQEEQCWSPWSDGQQRGLHNT